jgi:hypothetical protein
MLRFVVIESYFKHIVAADAHSVNLRFWLTVARRFGVLVGSVRLTHGRILSRLARASAPDSGLVCDWHLRSGGKASVLDAVSKSPQGLRRQA